MNISPINNINFGKKAVIGCTVYKSKYNSTSATLYSLDKSNPQDRKEVESDPALYNIKNDFLKFFFVPTEDKFYVLRDNDTGEVISYAETHHHKKQSNPKDSYTVIEEAGINKDYMEAVSPLVAKIAADAYMNSDSRIVTAFRAEDGPNLGKYNFIQTKNENWFLPRSRFVPLIHSEEAKSLVGFISEKWLHNKSSL